MWTLRDGKNDIGVEILSKVYGQCWTLNEGETDMSWRVYSPEHNGILVQTTIGKLWDNFYKSLSDFYTNYAIGKVQYLDESALLKLRKNIDLETIIG